MSKPQIRSSQILTGYGPGSMVDLPDDSVIVAGLDTSPQGFVYRRLVHRRDLTKGKLKEDDGKSYSVVPIRFVRACPRGCQLLI